MQTHKFIDHESRFTESRFTGSRLTGSRLTMRAATAAVAAISLAMIPLVASAQSPSPASPQVVSQSASQLDARWQPWIGCWRPAAPQTSAISFGTAGTSAGSGAPLVCVVPATESAASSGVSVLTVAAGKIVARDNIDATGRAVAHSKDGCDGVESASWSADGHRLYTTSDFNCPGGIKRTSSGLFAISATGEWVNVQAVNASGNKGVRTLRYTDAGVPSTLPTELSEALRGRGLAVSTARAAAAVPLTTANVVEASRRVDPNVVEAWIVDRGQSFGVDAKQIVALADAGVPGVVTDAMVAVSYPKAFSVNSADDISGVGAIAATQEASVPQVERSTGRSIEVMMVPGYSPYDYSPFDYYGYGYSPVGYSPYGYSPYGYSPYGYSPYGYSPYGGGYYPGYAGYGGYGGVYAPPIIVLNGTQPAQPRGYAVKGRGYTQGNPRNGASTGSTAQPRPTISSSPGSETRPAPAPPASSGRTAHERP